MEIITGLSRDRTNGSAGNIRRTVLPECRDRAGGSGGRSRERGPASINFALRGQPLEWNPGIHYPADHGCFAWDLEPSHQLVRKWERDQDQFAPIQLTPAATVAFA